MAVLLAYGLASLAAMPFEPVGGDVLAELDAHGGDEVLERPVGGRHRHPALELRVGEVEHRVGQLGLVDEVGVVHEHPHPAGQADPLAVAGLEVGRRPGRARPRPARSRQPCLVEEADRAGRLRDEDVDVGLVALGVDRQREVGGVAVADVDLDAGLLAELVEQGPDQVLGRPL